MAEVEIKAENLVYAKPRLITDTVMHYCPGCSHGTVHKLIAEVIDGIKSKTAFDYGVFDCKEGEVTHSVTVDENSLIIVEGSYCMHPAINFEYDLKIFCTTDEKTQLSRIEKRNGEVMTEVFKAKWIPLENRYFSFCNIKNKCDIIIVT